MGAPATVKDNRAKLLERAMSRQGYQGHALIDVLHTAQGLYGFLSPQLLGEVAHKLKLPPSRVLGVATFYNFFNLKPQTEHTALVCTGTACFVGGADELLKTAQAQAALAPSRGQAAVLTVAQARCIGSCGLAPAVVVDGKILPKVKPAALLAELRALGVE